MRDVVIVGGGPAGAATAALLARRGLDVLLLERRSFPRDKPCGDCISPGANALLDRLGALPGIEALRPARLDGWKLRSPAGAVFTGRFGAAGNGASRGLALPRSQLDAVLLEIAGAAGAEVRTGVRVHDLLSRDGSVLGVIAETPAAGTSLIRSRLTVGADGLRSVVVRRLGLIRRRPRLRKVSLTSHVRGLPCDPHWGELHIGRGVLAGLAPVRDDPGGEPLVNLSVVAAAERVGRIRDGSARDLLMRLAARLDGLRDRIGSAAPGPVLASGPFDWPVSRRAVSGAALVGDAAGYYDPLTGQGIYHALAGAELLAEEAARELGGAGDGALRLEGYERRHRSLTSPARRLQWLLEQIVSRPRLADRAFALLAHRPRAADELVRVTGDLRHPADLLSPPILSSLAFGGPSAHRETR